MDLRTVRRHCTTQEPRLALRITRLFFKILLQCLRGTRLERKSMKNHSKIYENPSQIESKSMKNRSWVVLGAQGRFGDASGQARDSLRTPKCHPKANLGTPGRAKSGKEPSKSGFWVSQRCSKSFWGQSEDAAVCIAQRSGKRLRIHF